MRSGTNFVNSSQTRQWALEWLLQADLLKARGRVCTAVVVWSIVLRAASRMVSIFVACQDLADAPSSQAVFDALVIGLPKTLSVLERRLNESLTGHLPRRMRRRSWQVVSRSVVLWQFFGPPSWRRASRGCAIACGAWCQRGGGPGFRLLRGPRTEAAGGAGGIGGGIEPRLPALTCHATPRPAGRRGRRAARGMACR